MPPSPPGLALQKRGRTGGISRSQPSGAKSPSISFAFVAAIAILQITYGGCAGHNDTRNARFDVVGDFGAVCDDKTDDYEAIQSALDAAGRAGGGVVLLPSRTCKTGKTLHFNYSNITLSGKGKIDFVPIPPFVLYVNDRAVQINDSNVYATNLPIAGPIKAGDRSFMAQSAGDAAGLNKGDWVVINEIDQGAGSNIVAIEWTQVASVSGVNVTVQVPVRVNFPNTRPFIAPSVSGLGFFKVERLIENTAISDIYVQVPQTAEPVPGIAVGVARNTTIMSVTVDVASGNGFFAYRSSGLRIVQSHQVHARTQATEMAAVTDLVLSGNVFDNGQDPPPDTSSLTLDFGTGFFDVIDNRLINCGNICMQVAGGVHDGRISANSFGYVSDAGNRNTAGIVALGVNAVEITGNALAGGAGESSTAVAARNTAGYTSNIVACGNQFGPNLISGFVIHYSPPVANDSCNVYVDSTESIRLPPLEF